MKSPNYLLCALLCCLSIGCATSTHLDPSAVERNTQESVALSVIAQEMSMYVVWDPDEKKAMLAKAELHVVVEPGNQTAWVCGEAKQMKFAAYVKNGEVHVPVSFYHNEVRTMAATTMQVSAPENGDKENDKEILPDILTWEPKPSTTVPGIQVVVDAGHGGHDPGAKIPGGGIEKTVTLDIAHKLASQLKEHGVEVLMTRTRDVYLPRDQRVKLANDSKASCFVSIHLNSAPVPAAGGFEIWISPDNDKTRYAKSLRLARHVRAALKKGIPLRDRNIRRNDFQVIRDTSMPAVLVECAFVTNPQDLAWLLGNQETLVQALAQGILSFLASLRK